MKEESVKERMEKVFSEQEKGTAKPEYPDGKIGSDDQGSVAIKYAVDPKSKRIIILYPKPITWLGLDLGTAKTMRDILDSKIAELEGLPQ